MQIQGPTALMHLGHKQQSLCAPLLVSPVISIGTPHERPLLVKGGIMGEKWPNKFNLMITTSMEIIRLQHGTDGFTSPLKEGMMRIFSPKKSDGFGHV
jgi:hypothetical protein